MKVAWSRELPRDPSSVTVIKDAAGRYFASFVVQTEDQLLPPIESEVGIDLGLTTFAALSNGKTIDSPKFLRQAERHRHRAVRRCARRDRRAIGAPGVDLAPHEKFDTPPRFSTRPYVAAAPSTLDTGAQTSALAYGLQCVVEPAVAGA